jgi:hypothetical protein
VWNQRSNMFGKILALIGVVILAASAVPIYLQVEETRLGRLAYARYAVHEVDTNTVTFGQQQVRVRGAAVEINGHRFELPRHAYSAVALLWLSDRRAHASNLVLIGHTGDRSPQTWGYDMVLMDDHGRIHRDAFAFDERDRPLYRTILARYVSPADVGFRSQVLTYWPTGLYPVIYPWATAAFGGLLIVSSLVRVRRQRASDAAQ